MVVVRGRELFAILVALSAMSCNRIAGPDTTAARHAVSERVAVLKPNGHSYVAHAFGGTETVINVGDWLPVSFAPDLSAYVLTNVESDVRGRLFRIDLARVDGSRVPVLSVPIQRDLPKWKLRWGTSSADPLVVQIDGRLIVVCQAAHHEVVSSGVVDFAVGDDEMWVLRADGDRKEIVAGRWEDGRFQAGRRFRVFGDMDGIEWLRGTEVVGYETAADLPIKERLRLIDVASGRSSNLPIPARTRVLGIVPIRGTSKLILDEWDGEERVDGTLLSKLYLVDLAAKQHTWIWTNSHDELLHERPANAGRFSCPGH